MALVARNVHVRTGERKLGERVVIERRRRPGRRVMAGLASLREPGLRVIRICRLLKIRHVATRAGCGRPCKFPTLVTSSALQCGMRSRQGKSSLLQVIELCVQPGVGVVALFAGCGKAAGGVIRLCVLVILGVA